MFGSHADTSSQIAKFMGPTWGPPCYKGSLLHFLGLPSRPIPPEWSSAVTQDTAVRRIYQRGALNIAILYKHQSCELIARLAQFELFYWFRIQKYNLVSQRLCHNWLNYAIVFKWCQKWQILQHFSRNMHKFCTFLCTTDVRYIAVELNMTMNTIR